VEVDTVGAVALDGAGALAAGSSTGGVFGKMPGRMGDSAIFGAGHYASKVVAVVGTGVGEMFLETLACARAAMLIEAGVHPQSACEDVVSLLAERAPLPAGLLALDRAGRHGAAYRGGSWDVEGPDGPVEAARLG
ncbi:MAG: isoaspartyl peptidase/L-asparaginase, partial [Actinomycetota bacterium]|nr:isoaspartyl peptidase/L-asparaginase [Actinomycetota bacterium]